MPRLFIALGVPAPVRATLATLRTDGLDGARWTPPEQFHCTLRFLGDTPEERVPMIETALAGLDTPPPLDLAIDGVTAFPSRRRPRVLVARIARNRRLLTLQQRIDEAAQQAGCEPEDRPFRPHVTLARLREADARAVHAWIRAHPLDLAFCADAFHLVASTLETSGAVHERIASFSLRSR